MGAPKGSTNNPNGRPKGVPNKIHFDIKKQIAEGVDETFIKSIFTRIEGMDSVTEQVKAQIKLVEFFVPKPRDAGEIETENLLRSALMDRIFPKKDE